MPFAQVNGIKLHYRIDDKIGPAAPWLMPSNSLGSDISMWTPQVERFSMSHRVLRYDTRGHGQSDAPPGPYTIEQLAGDVTGLLDAMSISSTHYCGLSMGGMTGIAIAARHPERLSRVVLSNTAARIGANEVWTPRAARARNEGMSALCDGVLARWFTADFFAAQPLLVAGVRDVFVHTSAEGYAANCGAIRDTDLTAEAKTIRSPVLVIGGTHDLSTAAAQGRSLAASIHGARYFQLKAAHLSNIEKPDGLSRAVLEFLGAPS